MNDRHDDEVRRWATTLIGQLSAAPLPTLGSSAWVQANGSVRLASAVRAALAWYEDADPHRLAAHVEQELEAYRLAEEGDYAAWRRLARRVRADAGAPPFGELQRRRSA